LSTIYRLQTKNSPETGHTFLKKLLSTEIYKLILILYNLHCKLILYNLHATTDIYGCLLDQWHN
jgi:hypothetical protein